MKRIWQAGILAAAIFIFAGFALLQRQNKMAQRYEKQFFGCFDTVAVITGYDVSRESFAEKEKLLEEKLAYYHRLYDIYHDYDGVNNIKTINDAAGKEPVEVDEEIINLLKFGKNMYRETGGKLNIAYGSVLSLWHKYRQEGMDNPEYAELPPEEELNMCAAHTDIDNVVIEEEKRTVYLKDPGMSLDVGSIGKGYAVQRLAEYAEEIGMEHALISVGGNVCAVGAKEDGTPWNVGVENPDADGKVPYIATVELNGNCAVTSGDYQRYYEVDGVRYCHIIDPDTNMPPSYFTSVTVRADDSGVADALSTALFNMTYEEGLAYMKQHGNVEVMWVGKDGRIRSSGGFKANEEK